eukprot:TRINITY_DN435_c0_g6_i2.p1 TRINITY_DN435_c0_g6~~TRINITY_DN435_c0_g6_i2.p1  ORF type:complete len:326 (-),score=89.61 TRINITY_DN435_c0_g6_i2:266-1243(-)
MWTPSRCTEGRCSSSSSSSSRCCQREMDMIAAAEGKRLAEQLVAGFAASSDPIGDAGECLASAALWLQTMKSRMHQQHQQVPSPLDMPLPPSNMSAILGSQPLLSTSQLQAYTSNPSSLPYSFTGLGGLTSTAGGGGVSSGNTGGGGGGMMMRLANGSLGTLGNGGAVFGGFVEGASWPAQPNFLLPAGNAMTPILGGAKANGNALNGGGYSGRTTSPGMAMGGGGGGGGGGRVVQPRPSVKFEDYKERPSEYLREFGDPAAMNASGGGGSNQRPEPGVNGNWECEDCKNVNFPRRASCFQCHKKRGPKGEEVVREYVRRLIEGK